MGKSRRAKPSRPVQVPPGAPEPPMFEPDPELVGHIDGSRFWATYYRKDVQRQLEDARREWAEGHPDDARA